MYVKVFFGERSGGRSFSELLEALGRVPPYYAGNDGWNILTELDALDIARLRGIGYDVEPLPGVMDDD